MGFSEGIKNTESGMMAVLGVAAILFFTLTGTLAMRLSKTSYPSPDETAAAVFMGRVAHGQSLSIPESLNGTLENIVHPRSTTIIAGAVVPQGFPAQMILWGTLTRFTGLPFPLWTPFFAALTMPMLFPLLRLAFPREIAFLATVLAFAHPALIYLVSRGLYTNAPQICFLVAAFFALKEPARWRWFAGGALLALALALRPSEVLWIVPLVGMLAWFSRASLRPQNIVLAVVALAAVGGIGLALYHSVYAAQLVGYPLPGSVGATVFARFSLREIFRHSWEYLAALFWWWSIPLFGGLVVLSRSVELMRGTVARYTAVAAVVAIVLVALYGSWGIRDTLSSEEVTIGTSFVRYWLPVTLFTLPVVAIGVRSIRRMWAPATLLIVVSLLYPMVWGFESVAQEIAAGEHDQALVASAQNSIPHDAVLIVERSDKIFWPTYRVIGGATEQQKVLRLLPKVTAAAPLYLHRVRDLAFASFWNLQHLRTVGLSFGSPVELDRDNELVPIVSAL